MTKTAAEELPLLDNQETGAALSRVSIVPQPMTPMEMLDKAIQSGATVEVMERLMLLQERWEANQARKDFDAAIALAKAEIPAIIRNREGHQKKKYADFAAIAATVDPILTKNGLSYRFRSTEGEKINVTCVLSHKSGHSEETTLSGPPDISGSKNAVQAIGSTLTYLQRYSLVQALGLAAADDDDAMGAAPNSVISKEQFEALRDLVDSVGADAEKFCQIFKVDGIAMLPASRYDEATLRLKQYGKTQGKVK